MALTLSERDSTFIATAFQCMESKPQIDYEKFAKLTGLKGAKSARDSFTPLLKRLMASGEKTDTAGTADADEPASPSKPVKKSAAATRKRKTAANDDDGGDSPKKKTTRGKKNKADEEGSDDAVDAEESPQKKPVKKKPTAASNKKTKAASAPEPSDDAVEVKETLGEDTALETTVQAEVVA